MRADRLSAEEAPLVLRREELHVGLAGGPTGGAEDEEGRAEFEAGAVEQVDERGERRCERRCTR